MADSQKKASAKGGSEKPLTQYERKSLWLQLFGLIMQGAALLGVIVSIWLLYAQVVEQTRATIAQYDLLDASVYQDLMSKQLELDKLLIEKPRLSTYIYSKRRVPRDKVPPDALGAAAYHLDFFQLVFNQRSRLPALRDERGADWITWKNTMASAFKESRLLCEELSNLREMYGEEFANYVLTEHDWCKH